MCWRSHDWNTLWSSSCCMNIGERSPKVASPNRQICFLNTTVFSHLLWFLAPLPRKWSLVPSGCATTSGNFAGYLWFGFVQLPCLSGSVSKRLCILFELLLKVSESRMADRVLWPRQWVIICCLFSSAAKYGFVKHCLRFVGEISHREPLVSGWLSSVLPPPGEKKQPPKNFHPDVNRFHKDKMFLCLVCVFIPTGLLLWLQGVLIGMASSMRNLLREKQALTEETWNFRGR